MKLKKVMSVLLASAVMLGALTGCGGDKKEAKKADTVKVGVFLPLTGDNAAGGELELRGVKLAHKLHPEVLGKKVELVVADNKSDKAESASVAARLIEKDKVCALIGTYGSSLAMAAGNIVKEAKVPAIGTSCTNPQVTADCDVYFRLAFLDPFQGTVLANYAYNELGVDTAYTLAMLGSDYDQGLVHYFTEAFTALGGTVKNEDFPEGNSNFVSYINNAKADGAGVIFAPVSTNYAQLIIEAAGAQGYEGALLGSDTWDNNMVLESAQGKAVDVKITTFYQESGSDFDTGIKEWINANADAKTNNGGNDMVAAVSAMGYDAYYVALEALKAAGSVDPAAVQAALPSINYTGVTGVITFNDIGDANRDTAYIKKVNTETGAWDFVAEQGVN